MGIDYDFKDKELERLAMTHISYANEHNTSSNQRLEFLGDSVLSFIIADYLYNNNKELNEGRLTEYRAQVVCEKSLAKAAARIDLSQNLIMGNSEKYTGGKDKPSILADTFEAVLGAIYLEAGIEAAREWALKHLSEAIENPSSIQAMNYKSELQNIVQKTDKGSDSIEYKLKSQNGPDHMPHFTIEVVYKGKIIGEGKGKTRKNAEQQAAKCAYEKLMKDNK